ncbi:hypothetical protein SALBM311S_03166 [Streptomyces alboniger]
MEVDASKYSAHVEATSGWWPLAQGPKPNSPQPIGSWSPCRPAKTRTMDLLGQLFNTTAMTISRAVKDVARFLDREKTKIKPTC